MIARAVIVDRETPVPLRPDLRNRVLADHPAHFIVDAVETLDLR